MSDWLARRRDRRTGAIDFFASSSIWWLRLFAIGALIWVIDGASSLFKERWLAAAVNLVIGATLSVFAARVYQRRHLHAGQAHD